VEILAAYSPLAPPTLDISDKRKFKYNILSGTSMACPHVAGVVAYVKSFHPDWSPAAIKSAIMTTTPMKGTYDDLAGEFAYGSGNINP
jgi:subtilisin family serine protease